MQAISTICVFVDMLNKRRQFQQSQAEWHRKFGAALAVLPAQPTFVGADDWKSFQDQCKAKVDLAQRSCQVSFLSLSYLKQLVVMSKYEYEYEAAREY